MIYLFRKRNGTIIAATKASASALFNSPNNFITHQPEYLGAVSPLDYKAAGERASEEVPIQCEKLVQKDGVDTLVTLTKSQLLDAIDGGDKRLEREYEKILKAQSNRFNELLEELAITADKNTKPVSYQKRIGAITDNVGDVSGVLKGYIKE